MFMKIVMHDPVNVMENIAAIFVLIAIAILYKTWE